MGMKYWIASMCVSGFSSPTGTGPCRFVMPSNWGASIEEIHDVTYVDPWFLQQIRYMVSIENRLEGQTLESLGRDELFEAKQAGFSDKQIAWLLSQSATPRDGRSGT